MNTKNEEIIIETHKGCGKYYNFHYKEYKDIKENCIKIIAEMKIDLNSKAAVNKINKSWKKDKSPLLTELQEQYRDHLRSVKEEKEAERYEIIQK